MDAADRLAELASKIEGFTARVQGRYPGALACAPGCADCCRRELTVTAVEAAGIAAAVAALPAEARAELASRARHGAACVALDEHGRCAVYAARPIVCRSHGVPIRFVEPAGSGKRALPVLDVCPKNFNGVDLADVDPACVLDQQQLSVLVGGIDALFAQEIGAPRGARHALRDVVLAAATDD